MKLLNSKTNEILEMPDEMSKPEVDNALASYNGEPFKLDYKPNFYERTVEPALKDAGIDIKVPSPTSLSVPMELVTNATTDLTKNYLEKYGKGDWSQTVIGWDSFFTGVNKTIENLLPGKVTKTAFHDMFVGPMEDDATVRTESLKQNPSSPAGEFIGSVAGLVPSLAMDTMTGGVVKEYLLGRAVLAKVAPYLAKGAGWVYGSMAREYASRASTGDVLGAVIPTLETGAQNLLFSSAGTGWKSIVKMAGIGESEAYYSAWKDGRPMPTVEEINKSTSHAIAMGTIFAGMHIFERISKPDQTIIMKQYEKDLSDAIETKDMDNITKVYSNLLADKRVAREVKDTIVNTYNTAQEEYINSQTADNTALARSLALSRSLEVSGYNPDVRRWSINDLARVVEDNIKFNCPIADGSVVKTTAHDHMVNKANEMVEPLNMAHKDMKDTLISVGMSEEQAEHNSRIYRAMIRQIAKREGRPVQEVHEEKMPEIFKASSKASGESLKQKLSYDSYRKKLLAQVRDGNITKQQMEIASEKYLIEISKPITYDGQTTQEIYRDLMKNDITPGEEPPTAKGGEIEKNIMPTSKLFPKEGGQVLEQRDFANISRKIANLSDKIPQAEGAGKIPNEVKNEHTEIELAAEDFLSMIYSNPDRFPVESGSPIRGNIDYGPTFTPDSVCAKGKALKIQVVTMRKALEEYLPEPKGGEKQREAIKKNNAEIRTAANRKIVEAGLAQGLETPCLQCYEFEKQITGFNAKPLSLGTRIYKTGSLERHADFLKKTGILRGYGVGDFQAADLTSMIRMAIDIADMKVGYGQYTKNLNLIEIMGDTGMKFNISCGATEDIGLPIEVGDKYAQRYKNTGVLYVAINDADLTKARLDNRVHNIIPVHLGGGTPKEWLSRVSRLDFENFQKDQSEKVMYNGKKKSLHAITDPEYVEAMDIIKKGAATKDVSKYLDAIDKASELVGPQIIPKFAEYFKATKENGYRELEKVKGYEKMIGVYGAEYGKDATIPKINISKMNLDKARAYMETPNRDISSDANAYASMARSLIRTAMSDGVEGINAIDAMRLKQRSSQVGKKSSARGWIELSKDPEVRDKIFLAANKNASTFQHELAHWYLNDLFKASKKGLVDQDFSVIRDWLKIRDNQTQLSVKQHEQFARGWERYLREGKAPSAALTETFARFKAWLTRIYESAKQLRVPLSDDIRKVMDRMLSDEKSPLNEIVKDADLTKDFVDHVSKDFEESTVADSIRNNALEGAGVSVESKVNKIEKTTSEEMPREEISKEPAKATGEEKPVKETIAPAESKPTSETVSPKPITDIKGKEKPSKSFNDLLKRHEELFYGGPVTYTEMDRAEDITRGIKLIDEQPEYGRRVALGMETPPEGVTANSVSLAYSAKMKEAGNLDEWYKTEREISLRNTRAGQELSTLAGRVDENSPEHFINMVLDTQLKTVSKKLSDNKNPNSEKEQLMQKIKDYSERLKKAVDSDEPYMKSVDDILKLFQQDMSTEALKKFKQTLKDSNIKVYEDLVADKLGLKIKPEALKIIVEKAKELQALSDSITKDILTSGEYWKKRNEMEKYLESLTPNHALKVWTSVSARGAMLMSFKSPITNVISNSVMAAVTALERRLGENWYAGLNNDYVMDYVKAVNQIYQQSGYDISRMDTSWTGEMRLGEEITHSQGEGVSRRIGRLYEDIVFKQLMGAPDVAFSAIAFADSANLASSEIATRSEGLTGNAAKDRALEIFKDASKIIPLTTEGQFVRSQAIADARYATYTNDGRYSAFAMSIRNALNEWTGNARIGDQVMPFVKTPANVVQVAIDFSGIPAAFDVFLLKNAYKELAEGNKKPMRRIIDDAVKGGIGTLLTMILVNLTKPDDFRGEYDAAEGSIGRLKNAPANSIKIGGKWISLDYLGPLGANYVGMMYAKKYSKNIWEKPIYYAKGAGAQLLKVPGAREFSELFEDFKTAMTSKDLGKQATGVFDTALNYARSRVVPGIVSDIARAFDQYERTTDSSSISQAKASIPGLRQTLPIKLDPTTGESVRSEGILSTFAFGSRVKTAIDNDVVKELSRLTEAGEAPSISNIEKSSPRVKDLRKQIGEKSFQKSMEMFADEYSSKVSKLIKTSSYTRLTDEEKKKKINSVKSDIIDKMLRKFKYKKPKK